MGAAGFWGFIAASSLILGALIALTGKLNGRALRLTIGFGVGALVSAVAYDLFEEAVRASATGASVAAGFVAGALTFYVGDELIERMDRRSASGGAGDGGDGGDGLPILLGAVLDGIPESIVLGLSLVGASTPSVAVLVAVFISNVPESVTASTKMLEHGRSKLWVIGIWFAVAVVSGVAAALGYWLLADAPGDFLAFVDAFAAGAILTLLADDLLPEAHGESDKLVGLMTAAGFAVAAFLTFTE
jgi:ZIP family zinc transporter